MKSRDAVGKGNRLEVMYLYIHELTDIYIDLFMHM